MILESRQLQRLTNMDGHDLEWTKKLMRRNFFHFTRHQSSWTIFNLTCLLEPLSSCLEARGSRGCWRGRRECWRHRTWPGNSGRCAIDTIWLWLYLQKRIRNNWKWTNQRETFVWSKCEFYEIIILSFNTRFIFRPPAICWTWDRVQMHSNFS